MNLRTDEFGKMEDSLKELYLLLLEKKERANTEYQNSYQETQRLRSICDERSQELSKVVAAYRKMTGKELK